MALLPHFVSVGSYYSEAMATSEMEIEKWTCEETVEWASKHYDEDVVKRFEGMLLAA